MDHHRFDSFTRSLAKGKTRRGVFAGAAGAVLAALGLRSGTTSAQALPGRPWDWSGLVCGGFAGIQCPDGYECHIDDENSDCTNDCMGWCRRIDGGDGEPTNPCAAILCIEGSTCCPNCGGICVPAGVECSDSLCAGEQCGPTVCPAGEVCCNESCGYCTPPDGACTQEFCVGEPCGPNTCGLGEFCCNESCGICAPIGGGCPELFCGEQCGDNFCGPDEFCCNPSCGTCAPIGGSCTEQACDGPPAGEVCGPTICAPGEVCCNESCGICTPPDGVCIMIACID